MRLIDADELKKKVYMEEDPYGETKMVVLETDVDEAPTIDAIHVVRCKDCKCCSVNRYADGNVYSYVCIVTDCRVEADDFCSWGERREDADSN